MATPCQSQRVTLYLQALSLSLTVQIQCVLPILFVAPPEKDFDWDEKVVAGANRFIKRAWRVVWELSRTADASAVLDHTALDAKSLELNRILNAMGIRCTTEFDKGQFNTAISAVMELINAASAYINEVPTESRDAALCYKVANDVVAMLAPIIPHWAEELSHEALVKTHLSITSLGQSLILSRQRVIP